MNAESGTLYLIPNYLGFVSPNRVFPPYNTQIIATLRYFIVENEKNARRLIKSLVPEKNIDELVFFVLNKHTASSDVEHFFDPLMHGESIGLLSDAGLPAVADPGSQVIFRAHQLGIRVEPLVGPSSVFLALMASGLNGQSFTFHGYLPINKTQLVRRLRQMEKDAYRSGQTQIFIETPYRNHKMFDTLLRTLSPHTRLCVATDLTHPKGFVYTRRIDDWNQMEPPNFHKRPSIFLFAAP